MTLAMIINLAFLAIIFIGMLSGLRKGIFKVSVRMIYLIILFIVVWLLVPMIYKKVAPSLPNSFYEGIEDYITKEELNSLAPVVLRSFLTPYIWLILSILTLPIYWIIYAICKKIFIKKVEKPVLSKDRAERKSQIKAYKRAKKPKAKSRLIGSLVSGVGATSMVFALFLPFTGIYETLRDEHGTVRCIQIDDFDSCKYTDEYEASVVSKIFSIGDIGSKAFDVMSSGKAFGDKVSLGEDLSNLVDIYFILQENGITLGEDIEIATLLSSLSKEEVLKLKTYLTSSKFLMTIVDNIGLKVLIKEAELDTKYGIDLSQVKLSKELGILMDVAATVIELPLTKDGDMNKNYIEIINSITDEEVDQIISSLKDSAAIDAIMEDYGRTEIEELINESFEDQEIAISLNLTDVDIRDELKVIINSVRDLAALDIIYYNENKDKLSVRKLEKVAETINKTELKAAIDGLFDSAILSQVVEGVGGPLTVQYINEALGEEYTAEELGLDNIDWKEELSNDVGLIIDLINSGVVDAIEGDSGENIFSTIASLENKDEIIESMTNSKLIVSMLDGIAPTYIEEIVSSMSEDPNYKLDTETMDIDWKEELPALINLVGMLEEGGVFEDDFDFISYVSDLNDTAPNDEVAKLANYMTSSTILMEVFPTIADQAVGEVSDEITIEDVNWKVELEPLLRVVKLFDKYGIFEENAETSDIVMDMLEEDSNIDILFNSGVVYDLITTTVEDEIAKVEVDGAPLVEVPDGGFDFTKAEWKEELLFLSDVISQIDILEEFENIGKMDPDVIINNTKLTQMGELVDTLLDSRIFGEAITEEINDILELTGEDRKSVEELRATYWADELIAANKILYRIDEEGEASIELVEELVQTAKNTVFIRDLVSIKVKDNLKTLDVEGQLVFEESYIDTLDIYTLEWDKEKEAIEALDTIDDIKMPGDLGFDANVDGVALNSIMSKVKVTTIVKDVALDTMNNEVRGMVDDYFYEDVNNPTLEEELELDEYMNSLDVLEADYVKELKLLDELNGLVENQDTSINDSSYGAKLDSSIIAIEESTIIGPVAEKEIRIILDDTFGTYFEPDYFSTLELSTISWEAELSKKSSLETFKDGYDIIADIDSDAGLMIDNLLAEIKAPVDINGDVKYSIIVKTVVEKEIKDRIKDGLTSAYNGDTAFIDELDIYNMDKYNSSFKDEFGMLDSLEEIASDSYVLDPSNLALFEEGGAIYEIAQSVLATNILDGSDVTLEVYLDFIKDEMIARTYDMSSCAPSLDLENASYGKDVIASLFVVA